MLAGCRHAFALSPAEPPQVTVELQQQEVVYGETVRFACQARGKPAPSVTWLHNAQPLSPSPRHRLTSRMLRVSNVGPQDEGLYQCMAENGVGSSQASARLIIVSAGRAGSSTGWLSDFHFTVGFLLHNSCLYFLGVLSRGKLPSIFLSPDKVLREQPPVRPGASGAMLPLDCSELPGHILPAEAPIILSQPRTGKADYYELIWRPRHERGVPVLEYMIKYRKVCLLQLDRVRARSVLFQFNSQTQRSVSVSGGRPSGRVDLQQYLRLPPQADSGQTAARQPV